MRDGDLPRAYLMLYRETTLVMNHLRNHPEYKDPQSRQLYRPLLEDIPHVVQQLERIKPVIQDQYDEYERMTSSRRSRTAPDTRPPKKKQTKILDVADNVDLAVDIAQEELRKRDSVKRPRQPGDRNGRVWRVPDRDAGGEETAGDLQAQLEATRRTLDSVTNDRRDERMGPRDAFSRSSSHTSHHYPPTSRSRPVDYAPKQPESRPQRPPKEPSTDMHSAFSRPSSATPSRAELDSSHQPLLPSRPDKTPLSPRSGTPDFTPRAVSRQDPLLGDFTALPSRPDKTPLSPRNGTTPLPPRPRKDPLLADGTATPPALPTKEALPSADGAAPRVAFRPAAYLENGDPMRYVFLPSQLRASFLELASHNTARGLEMCGILCGTPVNNALFVTTLIIPDQKCTPDTCETVNESALLDYCIAEDLLMIGWIHTHPTQSCFMSSRDLHTQAGYQVMMPESIAIVCAPRFEPSYALPVSRLPFSTTQANRKTGTASSASLTPPASRTSSTAARRTRSTRTA